MKENPISKGEHISKGEPISKNEKATTQMRTKIKISRSLRTRQQKEQDEKCIICKIS